MGHIDIKKELEVLMVKYLYTDTLEVKDKIDKLDDKKIELIYTNLNKIDLIFIQQFKLQLESNKIPEALKKAL